MVVAAAMVAAAAMAAAAATSPAAALAAPTQRSRAAIYSKLSPLLVVKVTKLLNRSLVDSGFVQRGLAQLSPIEGERFVSALVTCSTTAVFSPGDRPPAMRLYMCARRTDGDLGLSLSLSPLSLPLSLSLSPSLSLPTLSLSYTHLRAHETLHYLLCPQLI